MVSLSLRVLSLLTIAITLGCSDPNKTLSLELQKSYNTFLKSVEVLHQEGLETTVYFPQVKDYRQYAIDILANYKLQVAEGKPITFDAQGVVLARFLGLGHHRYQVLSVSKSEDGKTAQMRIKVNFAYDNTVKFGGFEEGSTVYIPKEPWGTVYQVVLGQPNELPRNQLKSIEIEIDFHVTNHDGWWQVRRCEADENSLEFEESFVSL